MLQGVVFTNETNLNLAEVSCQNIREHVGSLFPVQIISNDNKGRVGIYSANIEFSETGSHFSKTLLTYLDQIQDEFVIFFCDDYFLLKDVNQDQFRSLIDYMVMHGVDYFGFDDIAGNEIYGFEKKDDFYVRSQNYRYLYSVQPCIWKVSSLKQILKDNPKLSLHQMDETIPELKNRYPFLCLCTDKKSHFSFDNQVSDYYVFAYVEIIRHGVLYIPENGFSLSEDYLSVKFGRNFLHKYGLSKHNFKKFWCKP